MMRVFTSTE